MSRPASGQAHGSGRGPTQAVSEQARAKINLTLRVHGRRPDGYHELESLVVFAAAADELTLRPATAFSLAVDGPFAGAIAGENLIATAAHRLAQVAPQLHPGACRMVKNLPVASGIGGGSADAAAYLRAVVAANPGKSFDMSALAAGLGADVPVCLASRPVLMTGIGEHLAPWPAAPQLAMVLVTADVEVPATKTRDVFRRLAAPPLAGRPDPCHPDPLPSDRDGLLALMARIGNDLAVPAYALWPRLAEVEHALKATRGCLATGLSGAGPTTFAIFTDDEAARAAAAIRSRHPAWWVTATTTA